MVFIGKEGNTLDDLKEQAAGLNIKFLTDIPREDTVAAYHEADIFLFASSVEASPLVILEAKASKTPFVSTDCGNVKEWEGGIVCGANEISTNANKILDNEKLRKRLAADGYKEWEEKHTWGAIIEKYENLFVNMFSRKSGKAEVIKLKEATV